MYIRRCLIANHVTPWTAARQAPLSIGFPRQEYWSELSFPSPGDWPNPGIQLCLLHFLHCRQILYLLSHQETFTFNEIHAN